MDDQYYDPESVIPRNSPFLQAIPNFDPSHEERGTSGAFEIDDYGLVSTSYQEMSQSVNITKNTPWKTELRVTGNPTPSDTSAGPLGHPLDSLLFRNAQPDVRESFFRPPPQDYPLVEPLDESQLVVSDHELELPVINPTRQAENLPTEHSIHSPDYLPLSPPLYSLVSPPYYSTSMPSPAHSLPMLSPYPVSPPVRLYGTQPVMPEDGMEDPPGIGPALFKRNPIFKGRRRHERKRLGLPILFEGQLSNVATVACADTGADSNIIAYEMAKSLALPILTADDGVKEFQLANGKVVKSIGTVSSNCDLAPGQPSMLAGLACFFYVFETLAVPLILGMPFLEETETLSKYRDRFVEQTVPFGLTLQFNLIGSPARSLLCTLGGEWATANTDSGSDADFLSAKYAHSREFQVEPNQETIMFADGSTDVTDGLVRLPLSIENMPTTTLEFHVFGSLTHDVIVGKFIFIPVIPNTLNAFEPNPIIIGHGSNGKHNPIITNNRDVCMQIRRVHSRPIPDAISLKFTRQRPCVF
ncbi:hypothetical protein PG997_001878 [Apiospora hydei]|uniref:Peptidase A2 domain-containing protein n=1 Tax=Apiospora hydei TaxID=1337664 RepID=A0ABR1X7T2_9PEZI